MKQEKTLKEWLEMLPEPYRTEALENAKAGPNLNKTYDSIDYALLDGFDWDFSPQGLEYWGKLYHSIKMGQYEIIQKPDGPQIPWPEEAKWENAPEWAASRAVDESGCCFFYGAQIVGKSFLPQLKSCGFVSDMTGIDWKTSLETRPK